MTDLHRSALLVVAAIVGLWESSAAIAGDVPFAIPMPLAGVSGPVGIVIAATAYGSYKIYRHYMAKD